VLNYFFGESVLSSKNNTASACIIWMHGLGADEKDMMGVANELSFPAKQVQHVYMSAPHRPVTLNNGMMMPAWYDIVGLQLSDREDKLGIEQSYGLINQAITEQRQQGIHEQHIYLAGFSQGGAMALYTALRYPGRLGGVIALSAYLPLAQEIVPQLDKQTPFFLGAGRFDPLVLPAWSQQSQKQLVRFGYQHITYREYPMEHSICFEELQDLNQWLNSQLQGANE